MTINEARGKMTATLEAYAERFRELGLTATVRDYTTDDMLNEYPEVTKKSVELWCELELGAAGIDEQNNLIFDLYAEIVKGKDLIKELDPEQERELIKDLEELYIALTSGNDSPATILVAESARAQAEGEAELEKLEAKLKAMKRTSIIAFALIGAAVIFAFIMMLI